MTLLDDPPVATEPPAAPSAPAPRSGVATWRFAARLARRETRRRPGRTVLAALLIAAPSLAMTLGSVLVRTNADDWAEQFERDYAGADVVVNPSSFGFATDVDIDTPDLVPPAGTVVDDHLWVNTAVTPVTPIEAGVGLWGVFTDLELVGDGHGQPIEVTDGRAPVAGEILLDADTADDLGVEIGDTVDLERPSVSATLVGIGRLRAGYWQRIIDIPGFDRSRIDDDARQLTTTYRLPDDATDAEIRRFAASVGGATPLADPFARDTTVVGAIAWGWVGGVLALVAVGIIVAAAFATSARRQLVTIGQLSANGATPSVVRRTLALQGTWTGLIGAVLGVVAGLAALPFARPWAERALEHDLAASVIRWSDLMLIVVTATVAATIAAAVPARSAARIPVMAALAGRRPQGRPPRWLVPTGIGLVGGGLGVMALSTLAARNATSTDVFAFITLLGLVAVVFGMCCATPLVVEAVGSLGRRASLSWRMALRALRRSRTRSSAVVAAIAVAVGGSVAASALIETTLAEEETSWVPTLPADTIALQRWDDAPVTDETDGVVLIDHSTPEDVTVPSELLRRFEAVAPGATFSPVRVATYDPLPFDPLMDDPFSYSGRGPLIADPALIRTIGLHPDDLATLETEGSLRPRSRGDVVYVTTEFGAMMEFEGDGSAVPPMVYESEDGDIVVPAPVAEHPYRYENWQYGTVIVTETAARELGFGVAEWGGLVQYGQGLTGAQRDEVAAIRDDLWGGIFDAFVEPGDPVAREPVESSQWGVAYDDPSWRDQRSGDVWIARAVVVGAALVVSLLVVAIGLSLAAAEGRDERNTLAVVGATPATMRRQAATRAVVLAGSGIALGIPTGFVPTWVLYRIAKSGDWYGETLAFPWLVVAVLAVGVPIVVGAAAWAGSAVGQRFRPPTPARRD